MILPAPSRGAIMLWAALGIIGLGGQGHADPEGTPQGRRDATSVARPMVPALPSKLQDAGKADGMALFPAVPLPGWPGMAPGTQFPPRNVPELQNYPESVEHYTPGFAHQQQVNPYNFRTLVRSFKTVDLPGVAEAAKERHAEPLCYLHSGYSGWPGRTLVGRDGPPVPVVRLKPGGEKLRWSLGSLPTSMYVLRIIGAIEPQAVSENPRHLILEMTINDGPHGERNHYVLRNRGADTFRCIGEFFFHVDDSRSCEVELGLHGASEVDVLAQAVDLHDVLAECARRAGKTQSILATDDILRANWQRDPETRLAPLRQGDWTACVPAARIQERVQGMRAKFPGKTDGELYRIWRQRRDDDIWDSMPILNCNQTADEFSKSNMTQTRFNAYGAWCKEAGAWLKAQGLTPDRFQCERDPFAPWRLTDPQALGAARTVYTLADLAANKPYPELQRQIFAWGDRFTTEDGRVLWYSPLANAIGESLQVSMQTLGNRNAEEPGWVVSKGAAVRYFQSGDVELGRDLALKLVRFARHMPAIRPNRAFSRLVGRHLFAHERYNLWYQYIQPQGIAETYDYLFPVIKDNQELADAVGRYIPWVKTPQDVITLLDTCLIQWPATQYLYWQYDCSHGQAGVLAKLAALQGDAEIAQPWVQSIFERTWLYPRPPAGIQDYMYLTVQRDGTTDIGSSFYTYGGQVDVAKWIEYYIRNGGDARYDLTDARRYPRITAGLYWPLDSFVAGMHHMAVGDVGGYYRQHGEWTPLKLRASPLNEAWRWTRDPRFAWGIFHAGQRGSETDAQWAEIEQIARATRSPYMSNHSRVMSDWGGILEGGVESDDFRLRSAARVRVGRGIGHAHADTLALGVWALGLPMATSANARGGYGRPETMLSSSHNLATIDGKSWQGHGWISALADMGGVHYLRAEATRSERFERQVALVELDPGRPPQTPPSRPDLLPGTILGKDVQFARGYVVDFVRAAGGTRHQYNFQGPPSDAFEWNLGDRPWSAEEKALAPGYPRDDLRFAGTIEDSLVCTFQWDRTGAQFEVPDVRNTPQGEKPKMRAYDARPAEQAAMGPNFDPASPRKYLRVHLLGQKGALALTAQAYVAPYMPGDRQGEFHRQSHVIRRSGDGKPLSSLFAAVFEPYAGKPTIQRAWFEGTPDDANDWAAVRIETTTGTQDLNFSDCAAPRPRTLANGTKVEAEYAYLSTDANGLRAAALVGGRSLESAAVTIRPAVARWEARVTSVDYLAQRVALDAALPPVLAGRFFEVGAPEQGGRAPRWTTFEAARVAPAQAGGTQIEWRKGADVFSGEILELKPNADGSIALVTKFSPNVIEGENSQLAATVGSRRTAWRCDVEPRPNMNGENALNGKLTLYGAGLDDELKPGARIDLWAFGPGDVWRVPSLVSIRSTPDGYEVVTDTPCEITIAGQTLKITAESASTGPLQWPLTKPK